jgi:UDP-N-acetylglucosamine 2-epimerase
MENKSAYDKMAFASNPFGDGTAAAKIFAHVSSIKENLNK